MAGTSTSHYVTLGKSGLQVCPIALGTLNFGKAKAFGVDTFECFKILNEYYEGGGNFIDTADHYSGAEKIIGDWLAGGHANRDDIVLSTKFTFPDNAMEALNCFGNGRKNIHRALNGSLKRLGTDFIDLYWLHCWDGVTPVEEVVATLDALVTSGKIRYWGLSNVPAWYAAKASMYSKNFIAMQLEYSLLERSIEREHIPLAVEQGLGICAWSPLAGGILTGKYLTGVPTGRGRFDKDGNNIWAKFSQRDKDITNGLGQWAEARNCTAAQMAIMWVLRRAHVAIVGASSVKQLNGNMMAWPSLMGFQGSIAMKALDEVSCVAPGHPYIYFEPAMRNKLTAGLVIRRR